MTANGKLTLDDIADLRAYEREREGFRRHVIEVKKRRRVHVGTILTLVFENRDTYNPLIPGPGQLCATVFLELTSDEQLREWLPKLVGIERSLILRVGEGDDVLDLRAITEEAHAGQLTREEVTASVHYVRWELDPAQVDRVERGPVRLVVDHPSYLEEAELSATTVAELVQDLRG